MELETLSLQELKSLQKQVESAITSFEKRQRDKARTEMEKIAKEYGVSLQEVITGSGKSKAGKSKLPAKFRNPQDPSQTWSGRGRQPEWYKAAIKAGKSDADLAA
ncbi:MAG: H-NS histone family protein [Pseudomonadota bacterium]